MELIFDTIVDPTRTVRLRPGDPVTPEAQQLARKRLELAAIEDLADAAPPWRLLSERFSILEAELHARCLSISTLPPHEFLEPLRSARPACGEAELRHLLPSGLAALAEDANLARLRFQLVPARVSEGQFFACYFAHVNRHRRQVLPPLEHVQSSEDDWESFLSSPLARGDP
ncbi:hypothetical protein AB1Y20_020414 [Prymnesium parvum]|uniref:BSD domain-containing protein n=1 Tax=Prymnesium parvum TaxID=97485 RepID=A0AB34JV09_PRYPA